MPSESNFSKKFREDLNIYPGLKIFQKIVEEGKLQNSSTRLHSLLDTKTRKKSTKKEKLQANATDEHRCKNSQQNVQNYVE